MSTRNVFYIGYLDAMAPSLARWVARRVVVVFLLGLAAVAWLADSQEPLRPKAFEWDRPRVFRGVLRWTPAPTLVVRAPDGALRRFWLVGTGKFGLTESWRKWDGQEVELEGHLLYRGERTMVEVTSAAAEAIDAPSPADGGGEFVGRVTLEGEIVDSKCFLGAMNPGRSKVHRACAVRCISGGIPPALWAHDERGDEVILLVDEDGGSIGDRVLDLVAEPVQIQGDLWRYDDVLVLRGDPAGYRRIPLGQQRE